MDKRSNKSALALKYIGLIYVIITLLLILFYLTKSSIDFNNYNQYGVIISFFPIGIISIFCLATSFKRGVITLSSIHWYFVALFFFLIPLLQFIGNRFLFSLSSNFIILGNFYIFIWCIFFAISNRRGFRTYKLEGKSSVFFRFLKINTLNNVSTKMFLLTLFSLLVAIIMIGIGGLDAFVTRASYDNFVQRIGGWGPGSLILRNYLQPLIFCVFIIFFGLMLYSKIKKTYLFLFSFIIISCIQLIINNPMMFPRFYAFAILLGLITIILQRYKKTNSIIYLIIIFVGLPLSSLIDQFRHITNIFETDIRFNVNWNFLFHGHFDAYENFIHSLSFVSESGIVYGKQFLGALLFFVPRSIWPDKPLGSGNLIAQYLDNYFQVYNFNVGFPLIAEMFINFHVVGLILGAIVYGFFSGYLDKYYITLSENKTNSKNYTSEINFYILLYPFLVGLFLFHLRGDLISSVAYSVGFILAFYTIVAFLKFKFK